MAAADVELPPVCTAASRRLETSNLDVYVTELVNPVGADIPGADTAPVGFVVLNRKGRSFNAVDVQFAADLEKAVDLTAACDVTVFLSSKAAGMGTGIDLEDFYPRTSTEEVEAALWRLSTTYQKIAKGRAGRVTVAWMNGKTQGAVFELALHCHLRCCDPRSQIALNELDCGLIPGVGGSWLLPRLTGLEEGLELILSGQPIPNDPDKTPLIDRVMDRSGTRAWHKMHKYIWDMHRNSPGVEPKKPDGKGGLLFARGWKEGTYVGRRMIYSKWYSRVQSTVKWSGPNNFVRAERTRSAAFCALNTTMRCFFGKDLKEISAVGAANAAALIVSSATKSMMRCRVAHASITESGQRTAARIEAAHGCIQPPEGLRKITPVYIGSPEDVALALSGVVARKTYVKLCALSSMDVMDVAGRIEERESRYSVHWTSDMVHFIQRCKSLLEEQTPSPEGYGALGIVYRPEKADEIKEKFLDHLREEDGWLYVDCSGVLPSGIRADFAGTSMGTTAEVVLRKDSMMAKRATCIKLLQQCDFFLLAQEPHKEGTLLSRAFLCIAQAFLDAASALEPESAGATLECFESALSLPAGALSGLLLSDVAARAAALRQDGLSEFIEDARSRGVEAAVRRRCVGEGTCDSAAGKEFLISVCRHASCLVTDDMPIEAVDYVFVHAVGLPPHAGGPFAQLDRKHPLDTITEQLAGLSDGHLLRRLVAAGNSRTLVGHPSDSPEVDAAVQREFARKYVYLASFGERDWYVPVLLIAGYYIISTTLQFLYWRFLNARPQREF